MNNTTNTVDDLTVPLITADQVFSMFKEGAMLVDVRTPEEQADGILEGALCIDSREAFERASEFGEDKEREIIVYCKSGGRSNAVGEMLKYLGYKNVYNGGGYEELAHFCQFLSLAEA